MLNGLKFLERDKFSVDERDTNFGMRVSKARKNCLHRNANAKTCQERAPISVMTTKKVHNRLHLSIAAPPAASPLVPAAAPAASPLPLYLILQIPSIVPHALRK